GLRARKLMQQPNILIAAAVLTVLLASPYLLNYDFTLLLVPLAVLFGMQRSAAYRIALALIYALPFLILGLLGRQGNFILPLCALALLFLLAHSLRPLDVSQRAA
ncbi:MAG: hypothetical protein ACM3MF_00445, partial [Anaerolineae bacterium]